MTGSTPLPKTIDTVEEIVAGLTKAQRREIKAGHETLFGVQVLLSAKMHPKVSYNLHEAGLAVLADPYRLRLTPLGRAVRQHLTEPDDAS